MKITIEQTSSKEVKTAKNGNPYMACGIKAGKWYNGCMFGDEEIKKFNELKDGAEISIATFQEEYQGKMYDKFRFPKQIDLLEERVSNLEAAVMGNTKKEEKASEIAPTEPQTKEEVPPETIENKENEPDDLPF